MQNNYKNLYQYEYFKYKLKYIRLKQQINSQNMTPFAMANTAAMGSFSNQIVAPTNYCAQNFWIGPSDAVRFTPKTSISFTAAAGKSPQITYTDSYTIFYSFTLISET